MILNLTQLKNKYSLDIKGVIHIGAHFGEEHNVYKSLGVNNIVYFEPVKKTFDVLSKNINDAILYNYALGNENKEIEMFIEDTDACGASSILQPNDNLLREIAFSSKELVVMRLLDSFNLKDYNFLNIDVQGYELEVLKGSVETLKEIDYIMCEINRIIPEKGLYYKDTPTIEDLIIFLEPYGFKLVEQDWAGISWGDGFFIKEK